MTPPEVLAYAPAGRRSNTPGWWVRVTPNKYPALAIEGSLNRQGDGMYDLMNGIGAHEVIIETPDHRDLADCPEKQIEDVLWAYRDRILDLKKDSRLEYVMLFKNHGTAAGATLSHAHSQLIATPIVPKWVREEVNGARSYYDYKERCVFCDLIAQETAAGTRVVAENGAFIAVCPFASRFPFEMWILPKHHAIRYEDLQNYEAVNLAALMKTVLSKLKRVLANPAYNFILHNAPLKETHLPHFHWHIEIMPRLTRVAGFEWGTGFYINPTPPEEAARFLREAE
jgi:UDPglucose--hexose-1-phosphate uridylyltransferase